MRLIIGIGSCELLLALCVIVSSVFSVNIFVIAATSMEGVVKTALLIDNFCYDSTTNYLLLDVTFAML